ncbi:hypothetical protein ACLB1E_19950 [Escherichia coli]
MAFTMLLLMPFAWGEPLLHIWLLSIGERQCHARHLANDQRGDPDWGEMVFFCVIGTPSFWCPP